MPARSDIVAQLRRDVAAIEASGPSKARKASRLRSGAAASDQAAGVDASYPKHQTGSERPFEGHCNDTVRKDQAAADDPAEQAEKAYQKILRCCTAREQSSLRMKRKLAQAGFSPAAVESALARAQRVGVIDDTRYAESLVRSYLAAGKGLREARRELERLGIDIKETEAYQEHASLGEEAEVTRAQAVLNLHPPRAKNAYAAAYRKLIQKGFSNAIASQAARAWYVAAKDACSRNDKNNECDIGRHVS